MNSDVMKRLLLSTLLLAMVGTTYADIQAPPASEYTATRKLGRAISNIFYGIEELPVTMIRWNSEEGNYAGFSEFPEELGFQSKLPYCQVSGK